MDAFSLSKSLHSVGTYSWLSYVENICKFDNIDIISSALAAILNDCLLNPNTYLQNLKFIFSVGLLSMVLTHGFHM
jgi:hypothetical protein